MMMEDEQEDVLAERPNKTRIKREMLALRDLGKQMAELSPAKLAGLPVAENIVEAVTLARKLKKSALKRQFIYIEKLLRQLDEEEVNAIRKALDNLHQPHREEVEKFHQVESWRDRLITGDNNLINELVARFPAAERQYLRQLVRNADREQQQNKPPKSSRILFKYLAELQQESPE